LSRVQTSQSTSLCLTCGGKMSTFSPLLESIQTIDNSDFVNGQVTSLISLAD